MKKWSTNSDCRAILSCFLFHLSSDPTGSHLCYPSERTLLWLCDPEDVAMEPVVRLSNSHERRQDLRKGRVCVVLMYQFYDRTWSEPSSNFVFRVYIFSFHDRQSALGTWEMAQWLGGSAVLLGDRSSGPSTHVRQLTIDTSSLREADVFLWILWVSANHRHIIPYIQNSEIK